LSDFHDSERVGSRKTASLTGVSPPSVGVAAAPHKSAMS
jgi:hypothetical protein